MNTKEAVQVVRSGIICQLCGSPMGVSNTTPKDNHVARFRACTSCGQRHYTEERVVRVTRLGVLPGVKRKQLPAKNKT